MVKTVVRWIEKNIDLGQNPCTVFCCYFYRWLQIIYKSNTVLNRTQLIKKIKIIMFVDVSTQNSVKVNIDSVDSEFQSIERILLHCQYLLGSIFSDKLKSKIR